MRRKLLYQLLFGAIVLGAVASRVGGATPNLTGQARAVAAATTLGVTTLADTGPLAGPSDSRDSTSAVGSLPSVFSGEGLRAVTVGWPDQVVSESSISNVTLNLAGTEVSAGVLLARVLAGATSTKAGASVGDLAINGVRVVVTGSPNQRIAIPGGHLVINEQIVSASGTTVNALHATVLGTADIVIASATAGFSSF